VSKLQQLRCPFLKRVPKASQLPADEKLSAVLSDIISHPDSVEKFGMVMQFDPLYRYER